MSPGSEPRKVTIAVEGCCHGELDRIYATLQHLEQVEGRKVDLLICCGDFQAVRNLDDLETMSIPPKYRAIMTFWKYYSGQAVAPIPTLFIGGNHEAASYLWELYYGGWAAPNIYFLGYAGVVRFGGIRIAGLSGIYSAAHYRWGHFEAPPYNSSTVRSAYHVRELEVYRLMQLRQPVDVFLSHDWPNWITRHGDADRLFSRKPYFQQEALRGDLGSPANQMLLDSLRPSYWFSAHLHCKFAALVRHSGGSGGSGSGSGSGGRGPIQGLQLQGGHGGRSGGSGGSNGGREEVAEAVDELSGAMTRFLSLDKCLPGREFLQVVELEGSGPLEFEYDEEWLAVLRATHGLLGLERDAPPLPPGWESRPRQGPPAEDLEAVRAALAAAGGAAVPDNFAPTAAAYDPARDGGRGNGGRMPSSPLRNPQTQALLALLGLEYNLDRLARGSGGGGGGGLGGGGGGGGAGAAGRAPRLIPATAAGVAPAVYKNEEEIDLDDDVSDG